ncbi:unnamed protein product [Pleuronectes platessa]|uniref:P/Homo B domain-containing protein n=1 Tax=Pleuronectes platessa TaxID=8262 RepID=A0A9N7YQ14_PLEPL|nr:unnamed protein product [Pleuronectes platessa]
MPLKGPPLCLQHPDWGGNYRRQKQQPSASARTVQGVIVSEAGIIFVNDLLPPHVGAISTYSAPAAHLAAHMKTLQLTCVYGFGLLDAGLMVQQAAHFNSAAHQRKCTQEVTLHPTRILSSGGRVSVNILSEACSGGTNEISNLEHVQVTVSISAVCRGDLSISLQSPGGTVSLLLDTRPNDASTDGLINWTLMTVHCWGEQARGPWSLQVTDHKGTVRGCGRLTEEEAAGALLAVTLILYGTYHPHQTTHEGPLQSIVSMGSRHLVPHKGVYQGDLYPPLGLIQWIYQMERDRKVRVADINVPARPKLHQTNVRKSPRDLLLL